LPYSTTIKLALKALMANKLRSLLSILGIVIGISSVIILLAAGIGAQNFILDTVSSFGSNRIVIFPGTPEDENGFNTPASFAGITITTLTLDDAYALVDNPTAPNITDVTATVGSQVVATSPFAEKTAQFLGTTPSYFSIQNTKIIEGKPFEVRDVESLSRVVILGPDIADKLFPNSSAVGQDIKINNFNFRVLGITEAKGVGQFGINFDEIIYLPITTGQKLLLGIDYVNQITATADSETNLPLAASQAKIILQNRHHIEPGEKDDFIVNNTKDALEIVNNITSALSLFLSAIAAISLLVGGIGIMNIMLVSVTERTKEIGLRKSIGATRRDILQQFITESVIITLIGGLIGISIGLFVIFLIDALTTLRPEVTTGSIILAVGVSTAFGLIFGFYPANQAAKLNPIEALRFQ